MIKISNRDNEEAVSIYFAGSTARAMEEAARIYQGSNPNDAVDFVINKIRPLIESAARAHEVPPDKIVNDLKVMILEGLS